MQMENSKHCDDNSSTSEHSNTQTSDNRHNNTSPERAESQQHRVDGGTSADETSSPDTETQQEAEKLVSTRRLLVNIFNRI